MSENKAKPKPVGKLTVSNLGDKYHWDVHLGFGALLTSIRDYASASSATASAQAVARRLGVTILIERRS